METYESGQGNLLKRYATGVATKPKKSRSKPVNKRRLYKKVNEANKKNCSWCKPLPLPKKVK